MKETKEGLVQQNAARNDGGFTCLRLYVYQWQFS